MRHFTLTTTLSILLLFSAQGLRAQRPSRRSTNNTSIKQPFSFSKLFKRNQPLGCPNLDDDKGKSIGDIFKRKPQNPEEDGAHLKRRVHSVRFDIIQVGDKTLDIPAFKQFHNNMTDFTADGETEFQQIIEKIRNYLGENTDGDGVTLEIIGGASQIPTSFDPSKPNNNILPNGSSIPGQTSVENNRLLAQARATELAKKIKQVFVNIEIITPALEDIHLGETAWTQEHKKRLSEAFLTNNEELKNQIYEPFQHEQFVKVISKEERHLTVKPNALEAHTLFTLPRVSVRSPNGEKTEQSLFVISERTFNLIKNTRIKFKSAKARNAYLKKLGVEIHAIDVDGQTSYYMLHGEKEKNAFAIKDHHDRVLALFKAGIVDENERETLKQIVRELYLDQNISVSP